jgi:aspartate/methionine/tyrosine aminotransferase
MYPLTKAEQFAVIAMVKERDRAAQAYQEAEEAIAEYARMLATSQGITEACALRMDDGALYLVPKTQPEAEAVTSE